MDLITKLKNNKAVWFLLSTVILVALVYFVDHRELAITLATSDLQFVALAIGSGLVTLLMWSIVWHRFFSMLEIPMPFQRSVTMLLAGFFLNALTPLGRFGGEPFIAHLIGSKTDATYQQALSSVSSADLSNAIPFITFGTLSVAYMAIFRTLEGMIADIAFLVIVLLFVTILVTYLLWFDGARSIVAYVNDTISFDQELGRFEAYVESGKERGKEVLERLQEVGNNPYRVLVTVLISHLAVLGHVGATYFSLQAVGIEPALHTVFLIVTLSGFLTFSPTPGSAGTLEAGFAALVAFFYPATSPATATSVAILYRVGTYLPGVIFGYIAFMSIKNITDFDVTEKIDEDV
ncbi:MAG: flippase-like domain-containing protein [Candidatus Nanohaloarchaeota archaeon QJJ-5]|nr:flippase-like domain-containing protein [Candidatus Nanohaloarchaeota archaeon QJJ-5]